jgi:ankyrin repeat protein
VNHEEILKRLATLDRAIRRANTRLLSWSPQWAQSPQTPKSGSAVKGKDANYDDVEGYPGVQTLKECISTAETVRDAFESSYDPDGKSLMRFSDDVNFEASDDETPGNSDLDQTELEDIARCDGDMGHDELFAGLSTDHDESTPPEVLSFLTEDLREHAQKDLDAGNPKRAEVNLVEAIKHAEERKTKHGIPFTDWAEFQETLAIIYKAQKKWAEARKVLHLLIQEGGVSESELVGEKAMQRSRQYLLLATVHLEMYEAHASNQNPQEAVDLKTAERFAKLAFNKRYKLRAPVVDRQDPNLLDCVKLLIKIHETQGRTVLAQSYHRQFIANSTPTNPLPDELVRIPSGNAASDFDVIDINDLLLSAIKTGDKDHIQSLLTSADVNCRCGKGRTPLMYAVEQEDEITIRKLLDHGAEINATTASGATALHQAVVKGNLQMVRLLLDLDAYIEAKDKNLATPLVKAVEKNHGLLVSYLLGQGADIHVKDKAGWTLLHHAAHNGAVDVLKHLLYPSHEMDVNAKCPAGKTALHYCAELTSIEPAKVLLEHGANVDALDANSRSPLFFAVHKPFNEKRGRFVTLLLENGAEINPTHLPTRQRDYSTLQNYPSNVVGPVFPPRRRESTSTLVSAGTNQSGKSFFRRLSLNTMQL